MRMTDGKRLVEITIQRWNGSGYDPDWSIDYFNAGSLPYDDELEAYVVEDVEYCIDAANSTDPGLGACFKYDYDGDAVYDDDMVVSVVDIDG